jgi:hypothetical protein
MQCKINTACGKRHVWHVTLVACHANVQGIPKPQTQERKKPPNRVYTNDTLKKAMEL